LRNHRNRQIHELWWRYQKRETLRWISVDNLCLFLPIDITTWIFEREVLNCNLSLPNGGVAIWNLLLNFVCSWKVCRSVKCIRCDSNGHERLRSNIYRERSSNSRKLRWEMDWGICERWRERRLISLHFEDHPIILLVKIATRWYEILRT
jgi:hypothetical protein